MQRNCFIAYLRVTVWDARDDVGAGRMGSRSEVNQLSTDTNTCRRGIADPATRVCCSQHRCASTRESETFRPLMVRFATWTEAYGQRMRGATSPGGIMTLISAAGLTSAATIFCESRIRRRLLLGRERCKECL